VAGELAHPVVVEFPLRGEGWVAVTSPADRLPSHGTDMLGQRYAFDFLMTDQRPGQHYHPAGWLRTFLIGVPTRECYAWGAAIHSPFDGEIVRAVDGQPERSRVHPVRESILAVWNAVRFSPARLPSILGNHVIARSGDVVAAFVHLAPGSVAVSEGQHVRVGDVIGRVGHTGNSTSPHLHFQLMDALDPTVARGVPCAFAAYEVFRGAAWQVVHDGIPGKTDRIRSIDSGASGTLQR
jgi:murein DD-endopeptidase MepM/ murein hydrolase activator NlpD